MQSINCCCVKNWFAIFIDESKVWKRDGRVERNAVPIAVRHKTSKMIWDKYERMNEWRKNTKNTNIKREKERQKRDDGWSLNVPTFFTWLCLTNINADNSGADKDFYEWMNIQVNNVWTKKASIINKYQWGHEWEGIRKKYKFNAK